MRRDDPVAFITARLGEWEYLAQHATEEPGMCAEWREMSSGCLDIGDPEDHDLGWEFVWSQGDSRVTRFVEANDPKFVLAWVAAIRAVAAGHPAVHRVIGFEQDGDTEYEEIAVCGTCVPKHSHFASREAVPAWPCRTVRHLAGIWRDHPGYTEE